MIDDRDAVRKPVGFLQVLRREEHRDAALAVHMHDLVPDRLAAGRIEPGSRLVEEQDLRVVNERAGKVQTPAHPA